MKKTHQIQRIWTAVLLLAMNLTQNASHANAGHGMNNGGDFVRATFMRMGTSVNQYLRETQEGTDLAEKFGIHLLDLEQTLNIDVLEVVDGLLTDNGGSAVDATGQPGKIRLQNARWVDHFESNRDVYYLVFHEMLRASGINDDNYIISKAIYPFPSSRRVLTRMTTKYPLLDSQSLQDIFDPAQIQLTGDGCPSGLAGTFIDFDNEKNQLDLSFSKFDVHVGANDPNAGRKSCAVVIPYKGRKGMKLKILQMDFSAKVELAPNATASIAAGVAFGSNVSGQKTSSTVASNQTQGRLLVRQGNVFESACGSQSGLISIKSAATATTQSNAGSMVSADHIRLSFMMETCAENLK